MAGLEVASTCSTRPMRTSIEFDLKEAVLSFQDHYEGQAGLIFWLPLGQHRISMKGATEQYFWKHRSSGADGLPLGRLLFSGEVRSRALRDSEAPAPTMTINIGLAFITQDQLMHPR